MFAQQVNARRLYLLLLFLCYGSISCQVAAQNFQIQLHKQRQLYDFFAWQPQQKPLISAHRGSPTEDFPENCLATFEYALSIAPALIECDVMLTKDSVAILMHDRTLDRTTTEQGAVKDYTWEQLQAVRLKARSGKVTEYTIPTLEEVLIWAKGKTILKLDVKNNISPEQLISLIRKHKANTYVVVITYNKDDALTYHQLAPELMLSVSVRSAEDVQALLSAGVPTRNLVAFVGVDEAPQPLIDYLHSLKISCILGTMRSLDTRAHTEGCMVYVPSLNEKKIDMLATDEIVLAHQAIEQFTYKKSRRSKYFRK